MFFLKSRKAFFHGLAIYLIIALGVILGTIVVVNFYRYRITIHIRETYEREYISNVLPVVLSSTYNSKQTSQLLGEYLSVGSSSYASEDVRKISEILKSKFDLVLGSDACYRFYVDDFDVKSDAWDESKCKDAEVSQFATMRISLPYSEKAIKQVNLVKKIPFIKITE